MRVAPIVLALLGSCSDSPTLPRAPEPATLLVTVRASGGDIDDSFFVSLRDGDRRGVGANSTIEFRVGGQTQSVELQDVAANCTVTSENPVSVAVPPGKSVEIQFDVFCATTGIRVTTRTSGYSEPATYNVALNNDQSKRRIGSNDSTLMSRLQPGTYTVALELPGHCTITGAPQQSVEVTNRNVTPVVFEVNCVAPVRTEKIAYVDDTQIALVNPDGSGAVTLATGSSPAWSRDGTKLAYTTYTGCFGFECGGLGLAVVDPETRHVTTLMMGSEGWSPAWAPTGDMLAYIECCSFGGRGNFRLAIIRLDGSSPVQVQLPSLSGIGGPAWSPDGRRIAFACYPVAQDYPGDICVVDIDGSNFVQLTSAADDDFAPAWSPDGSRIAFTIARFGATSIAVMNADGTGVRQIRSGWHPSWSPDGTRLVFAGGDGLFTVRLDGSDVKRLTTGKHFEPAWRP